MKLGYVVEGSTDRALLKGLRDRWCRAADLEAVGFRGGQLRRRHYPKACADARLKGVEVLVFLTDANDRDWKTVHREERNALPSPCPLDVIVGVCERNVECWLCSAPDHVASYLGGHASAFMVPDPKRAFEQALGITREEKEEERIAGLVAAAPLREWIRRSPSFKAFYHDVRDVAQRRGCSIPNEEDTR